MTGLNTSVWKDYTGTIPDSVGRSYVSLKHIVYPDNVRSVLGSDLGVCAKACDNAPRCIGYYIGEFGVFCKLIIGSLGLPDVNPGQVSYILPSMYINTSYTYINGTGRLFSCGCLCVGASDNNIQDCRSHGAISI